MPICISACRCVSGMEQMTGWHRRGGCMQRCTQRYAEVQHVQLGWPCTVPDLKQQQHCPRAHAHMPTPDFQTSATGIAGLARLLCSRFQAGHRRAGARHTSASRLLPAGSPCGQRHQSRDYESLEPADRYSILADQRLFAGDETRRRNDLDTRGPTCGSSKVDQAS